MAKKIVLGALAVLVLGIAAVCAVAAFQPSTYHVERSRQIPATPDLVQPKLADLRQWTEWNPWGELDPNMRTTFSDPSAGVDAWYEWQGNDEVGKGRMTITGATPTEVRYHLQFMEPFESEADITISLDAAGGGTRVTWAMDGENAFMSKLFGLFMDFDAMIGADFGRGLENLERAVTAG